MLQFDAVLAESARRNNWSEVASTPSVTAMPMLARAMPAWSAPTVAITILMVENPWRRCPKRAQLLAVSQRRTRADRAGWTAIVAPLTVNSLAFFVLYGAQYLTASTCSSS